MDLTLSTKCRKITLTVSAKRPVTWMPFNSHPPNPLSYDPSPNLLPHPLRQPRIKLVELLKLPRQLSIAVTLMTIFERLREPKQDSLLSLLLDWSFPEFSGLPSARECHNPYSGYWNIGPRYYPCRPSLWYSKYCKLCPKVFGNQFYGIYCRGHKRLFKHQPLSLQQSIYKVLWQTCYNLNPRQAISYLEKLPLPLQDDFLTYCFKNNAALLIMPYGDLLKMSFLVNQDMARVCRAFQNLQLDDRKFSTFYP